jgi:hypothetical protein
MGAAIAAETLPAKISVPMKIFPGRFGHALCFAADPPRAENSE